MGIVIEGRGRYGSGGLDFVRRRGGGHEAGRGCGRHCGRRCGRRGRRHANTLSLFEFFNSGFGGRKAVQKRLNVGLSRGGRLGRRGEREDYEQCSRPEAGRQAFMHHRVLIGGIRRVCRPKAHQMFVNTLRTQANIYGLTGKPGACRPAGEAFKSAAHSVAEQQSAEAKFQALCDAPRGNGRWAPSPKHCQCIRPRPARRRTKSRGL